MYRYLLISTLLFSGFGGLAGNIGAWLDYGLFYSPTAGAYTETYITIDASTLKLKPVENGEGYYGTAELTILFMIDEEVHAYNKTELRSPVLSDTSGTKVFFMDMQRFALERGNYRLNVSIHDPNNPQSIGINATENIFVGFPSDSISLSSIQLVESFDKAEPESKLSKSGYNIIPNTFSFYPENSNSLRFYCELYNSDKHLGQEEAFLVSYFIESFESGRVQPNFVVHKRERAKSVLVVFADFNISELGSGNYNMVVEVRNRNNDLLASRKSFFQRLNPSVSIASKDISSVNTQNTFASAITDIDTLKSYVHSLFPIATEMEKAFASTHLSANNLEMLQKFFFHFWYTRNSIDPQSAWYQYYGEVKKVNNSFSTPIKRGHETDRGRVYLMYGPPNARAESKNEPSSYPYEIWHYYSTKDNQTNKRFVFYNPDLVTNDYTLLHSDAMGEIQNHSWQFRLLRRNTGFDSIDDTDPGRHYGSRALDLYNNPR